MTRILRAGIIGLGVGEAHLRAYQALDNVEVGGICDIDPERLNLIGDRYGVARRWADYRRVVEDPDIDVVSVCSYDDAHAEQVVAALREGKHVMVEKPVVLHRYELEAVCRAVSDSGRVLTSNLILRHSPRFQAVREMVQAGRFGDIFHVEGDYLHQILWKITEGWRGQMPFYCTFFGGGIHLVDLMRWVIDQEVDEVCAMGTDLAVRGSGYRFPDTITALMRFNRGATGKCTTSLATQRTKFHSLNVYGTRGSFVNGIPHAQLFAGDAETDVTLMDVPYNPTMEKGGLLADFIDAVRQGRRPIVNEVDVFRIMDVCLAVWDATQTGRTVKVSYLV